MRAQYNHDVITSFVLWLDNQLCGTGQAFVNTTGLLYRGAVTGIPGHVYASPYRAWVWDNCTDAIVPTGFYTSSGQLLTAASGIGIDYLNGRVISPHNWGPTLSGAYARKEINVYPSTTEESNYILEKLYNGNQNIKYPLTGLYGSEYVAPLIMVTNARGMNEPWALGGMDKSINIIRCFAITSNNYLQEGVNSIIQDAAHSYIPLAPISAAPLTNVSMTATGTLKTPGWSYCNDIKNTYGCANGLYIDGTYSFKIGERSNMNPDFLISIMDVDLSKPRMPRG
jgi:hypothetical protein